MVAWQCRNGASMVEEGKYKSAFQEFKFQPAAIKRTLKKPRDAVMLDYRKASRKDGTIQWS